RRGPLRPMPEAVVFDLDGVLLDSEQRWNEAKERVTRDAGGCWRGEAPEAMMGMSSPEWSAYMRDELGVPLDAAAINSAVVELMSAGYERELPLLPGALGAVRAVAARWPLGLASSSNREIIDAFLERSGVGGEFTVTLSSEEVGRGKPAPDVYLEVAARLGFDPAACVAVEDSGNGLRAAAAAGMPVIAVPNPHYPPPADALALATATVPTPAEVTPELVERAAASS
ncbi:MAG TPA: HAD family phosphatase, partial [Solirubrobacterales bacterium]|nr:HAD family phosphatase [Solirubrobacterales bacterium]